MPEDFIQIKGTSAGPSSSTAVRLAATYDASSKVHTLNVNSSGGGGSSDVTLTGTQRTPAISTVTTSGSVAAGKKYIGLIFSSDFTGTVDGETFAGTNDRFTDFTAPPGDTLAVLAYTVTAGNIRIQTIT